jgi:hypothetical protein
VNNENREISSHLLERLYTSLSQESPVKRRRIFALKLSAASEGVCARYRIQDAQAICFKKKLPIRLRKVIVIARLDTGRLRSLPH